MPVDAPGRSRLTRSAPWPIIAALIIGWLATDAVAQVENPLEILAVRVREQGFRCDEPIAVQRDEAASRPLATVWFLQCTNASFRIVLHPDMGANIQPIQ